MDLAQQLREVVLRHGGAGLGICDADPFHDVRRTMHERIGEGSHAALTFTFTDPDVATDVRRSFPWAARLVVTAWSYLPEAGSPGPARPGTGRVARFATADHYRPLRMMLDDLSAELTAAGHRAAALSDDNRLVDRAAAVRAGVGWWGKNAMVLAPGAGPWLLLGSVATDAPLAVTEPMTRDCGTCSACLPACPTGALVAPGVLDARKCLARWLQAPGVIPRHYRSAVGDRVYGCDDCLDACPPGSRLLASAHRGPGRVDLAALLAKTDGELLDEYGHFYLPRRRPAVLRRNALIALGNTGGADAVAILAGYLGHHDAVLRLHAAWALGRIGGDEAGVILSAAREAETNGDVRAEIDLALR